LNEVFIVILYEIVLNLQLQYKHTKKNEPHNYNYKFFSQSKAVYRGKVREVYTINDELLVMVATDRLSFDVVLPKRKGQILNQIATDLWN
jgi:hypothetical protein